MTVSAATRRAVSAVGRSRRAWVLLAVSLGQFLIQLDLTIVNVALPAIGRDLSTSVSGLQWVVDGYNLALASLLLAAGRIGDRSGHRRVYLAGVLVFSLGSALCAAAPSAGALVAFRVLQGTGAAIELPATLAILTHTFTGQRERAQAVGIWASAAGSALVIGPVLGGGLVAAFGWRSVFLVNLPVTAAIGVLVTRTVRETPKAMSGGLDWPGQLQVQGDSAVAAGLRFVPLTGAFVLAGPPVGRFIDRIGHRAPMTAGCALLVAGPIALLRAGPHSGYGTVWWPFVIIGLGYGLLSTPMAAAVLGAVPRERAGMASSTNLTARLVGGVFGVAVLGALMSAGASIPAAVSADAAQALTRGLHAALVAAAAVALAGAVLTAAFIPGRPGAGSPPWVNRPYRHPRRRTVPHEGGRTG